MNFYGINNEHEIKDLVENQIKNEEDYRDWKEGMNEIKDSWPP